MNLPKKQLISILILCFCFFLETQANNYPSGHQALEVWDVEAQTNLPLWIKLWLIALMVIFLSGLFFVKKHIEARWLVGGVILGFFFSKVVVSLMGLVSLSGLVALIHIVFWSPALLLMLNNRPYLKEFSSYAIWSGLVTLCLLFSFFFDIRDAVIYLEYTLN